MMSSSQNSNEVGSGRAAPMNYYKGLKPGDVMKLENTGLHAVVTQKGKEIVAELIVLEKEKEDLRVLLEEMRAKDLQIEKDLEKHEREFSAALKELKAATTLPVCEKCETDTEEKVDALIEFHKRVFKDIEARSMNVAFLDEFQWEMDEAQKEILELERDLILAQENRHVD